MCPVLQETKLDYLPIVGAQGRLQGMVSRAEMKRLLALPPLGTPSLAPDGSVLVGAAIGTREADKARMEALAGAGVNAGERDSSRAS